MAVKWLAGWPVGRCKVVPYSFEKVHMGGYSQRYYFAEIQKSLAAVRQLHRHEMVRERNGYCRSFITRLNSGPFFNNVCPAFFNACTCSGASWKVVGMVIMLLRSMGSTMSRRLASIR